MADSDLGEPELRRVIRKAWQGRHEDPTYRYALVPVDPEYLIHATTYHTKATKLPAGENRLLPVSKGEPGYLEATWQTAGFWGESSLDKTWKALCAQWFPVDDPGDYQPGKHYDPTDDPNKDPISHRIERAFEAPTAR